MRHVTKKSFACWTIPAAANWTSLKLENGQPYFACGPVGFGKVGVVGLNPADLVDKAPAGKFWAPILAQFDSRCRVWTNGESPSPQPQQMMQYDNYVQAEAEPTNDVIKYLYDIPEMQPLSIWWIIGLLSALALVLGPLDYLVLKKLDRLPMTWITSTLVIVLFSVGAYYGVERIRGGLMQVRTVTVTDAVQGQPNSCFSTTLGGIFAPASDSYRLSDLKSNQWFTALSPEEVRQNYGSYSDEEQDPPHDVLPAAGRRQPAHRAARSASGRCSACCASRRPSRRRSRRRSSVPAARSRSRSRTTPPWP